MVLTTGGTNDQGAGNGNIASEWVVLSGSATSASINPTGGNNYGAIIAAVFTQ
jgi:hypothetical protein